VKRLFDLLLASAALLILSPLFLLISLLIRLDSEGPIFFSQPRSGRNGRLFQIYKFRTMVENAQAMGPSITARNDARITQIGHVLRWLKLDELPQFFNVLKGDMSIVGPRPELPEIVEKYTEEQKKILSVRPGILGSSQVHYQHESEIMPENGDIEKFYMEKILPEKLARDLAYIQNIDPLKDIKILLGGGASVVFSSVKWTYIFESRRRFFFLLFDLLICALTYWGAFALRFENQISAADMDFLKGMIPFVIFLRALCFVYFGLYQTLWQYLGIEELISIIKAVTVGTVLIPAASFLLQMNMQPRSTLIMDWFLLILGLGLSRMIFKITVDRLKKPRLGQNRKNALIIGAGDTGELVIREFIRRPDLGFRPAGFIDEDARKLGMRIHGIKVLGNMSQLSQIIRVKKIDVVVIALSEASGEVIKGIVRECRRLGLPCQIVPRLTPLVSPRAAPLQLREVDIADLLGRSLVKGDIEGIQHFFADKRVLITGAGGSIGSELVKLIHQNNPREIILVDNSENNLYEIEMQLRGRGTEPLVYCYLRDVKDENEIEKIFEQHRPEIVYHAAAYKHVPMVETHYGEGVVNNVLGTKVIADAAAKYGAESFVLISTDKAIRPRSIMGATKRICELYLQTLRGKGTKFMAVRFGNVFNSRGSVVPLFRRQIEAGGPLTVTDPDVKRYFMDLSEAVFLILEATILGKGAEVFVLEMGQPVKIVDLAKNLIQLMGYAPEDIPIKFTGLRPGEKMEEEIEMKSETLLPTAHEKIRIWKSDPPSAEIQKQIQDLIAAACGDSSRDAVIQKIREIVPEYQPWMFS